MVALPLAHVLLDCREHRELGRRKKPRVVDKRAQGGSNRSGERGRGHDLGHSTGPHPTLRQAHRIMNTMTEAASNPLARIDWDYIEFYAGNAKQAAHFYMTAFGFDQIAYAGPETGVKDRCSYVLQQNKLRFVITSSLLPDDDIAKHVSLHGD